MKTLLLFSLIFLAGCTTVEKNADLSEIKRVVVRYNELLIEGYKKRDMTPLKEVTTPDVGYKAYHHMSALGEGKLRMISTLKDMKFTKAQLKSPAEAVVETEETWDFYYINDLTGKHFYEEKDFVYKMGYILKKEGNSWYLDHVTTVSGEEGKTVIPWPRIPRHGTMSSAKTVK